MSILGVQGDGWGAVVEWLRSKAPPIHVVWLTTSNLPEEAATVDKVALSQLKKE